MRKLISLIALVMVLAACSTSVNVTPADLPDGDTVRGATLFTQSINGAPPCATCHTTDGSNGVGPSLEGFGERAASRASSLNANEYAFYSIIQPSQHIAQGFPNVMYNQYGARLSPQDIADLVAFVLSQ